MQTTITPNANSLSNRLITWQQQHGRNDLPWQSAVARADPYCIWVSEIMLQQTQVSTVVPYYQRFIAAFPDVRSLAAAGLDPVLSHWAGLGYYARARNLHHCARCVVSEYDGRFPRSAAELALLPGIGRSTAAAIAAFAYGEQAAILDGNVKRVLARLLAVEGWPGATAVNKRLWDIAESLLPVSDIRAYTQGMMDLGALLCTRSHPQCKSCPLRCHCRALAQNRIDELPGSRPGKKIPQRETVVLIITDRRGVWLERRPPLGIWGGLYSLPELETAESAVSWARQRGYAITPGIMGECVDHSFSHFRLKIQPLYCELLEQPTVIQDSDRFRYVGWQELAAIALPAPIRLILEKKL